MTAARLLLLSAALVAQPLAAQSSTPPPPPRKDSSPMMSAVSDAQKVKSMGVDGGEAVMRAAGQPVNDVDLKKTGNVLKGMGIAADVGKVTEAYIRGGQHAMVEKATAVAIDQCIDLAVNVGCTVLGSPTLLGAPAVAAACKLAVTGALLVAEKCFDGSIGDHLAPKAVGLFSKSNPPPPASSVDAKRSALQGQMNQMRSSNENAIEQQRLSVAASHADDYDSGPDAAAFMSILNQSMQAYAPPRTPVNANPSGCHPGHDEGQHPGGCNDYGNSGN